MSNEQDLLGEWLVGYLEADTELMGMVNGEVAPEVRWGTLPSPFIRMDFLDGEDLMVIGLHRVWLNCTYHIRAVDQWTGRGRPDRTVVNAIGARLDAILHDQEDLAGGLHVCSWREEPTPDPAVTEANGELWLQSGGVYRFLAVST